MLFKITKITFPGLFPDLELEVNSVAFTLFGHEFPWYAIIITLGIIFCYIYVVWRGKKVGISSDTVSDYAIFVVPFGVIGCRLYYVLTKWDYYSQNLGEIIKIWNGGLAIYGGLIAGAITVIVMCKIKKISFFVFADIVCPCIIFAQACGRWGNFFNAEAYGQVTDSIFRMGLQDLYSSTVTYVQPTFLYESTWNLIGFIIAHFLYKKKPYDGFIFDFVFGWYGFGRMFIEVLRSDSLYICSYHAWFTKISVIVGFGFFVFCSVRMIRAFYKLHHGVKLPLTKEMEQAK